MAVMRAVLRSLVAVTAVAVLVSAWPQSHRSTTVALTRDFAGIASLSPAPGELVGVGHPVVVTFRVPVTDRIAAERALAITSTPAMTGRFDWLGNTSVQWVPDRYWPAHTTVALSAGEQRTEFQTGAVVLGVADIAKHTFTVTVDGAPATSLPAPHHRPFWGEQGVMPASMGRPEFPSPVGSYTVLARERTVIMDSSSVGIPVDDPAGYRLPVDFAVRITNHGLFVHSAPWAVSSLGVDNVSHGCISLSPEDAEWYFTNVKVGDPVVIVAGVARQEKTADPAPDHPAPRAPTQLPDRPAS